MAETHVHRIVRQIGEEDITSALGVTTHSVRAAKTARKFPAPWYGPLKDLCDERGVPCPMIAFNWRSPDKKSVKGKRGGSHATVQVPQRDSREKAAT